MAKFQKGNKFSKGRPKGAINKPKPILYDIYNQTFDQIGGIKAFQIWASNHKSEFYKLHSKTMPLELSMPTDAIQINLDLNFESGAKEIIETFGEKND
ncbi:MAG: hypothetical protein LBS38_00230 [Endomicrobium sp.]|jgi:hypothetical protein|nr:hypothetical protein [Endomicrobium sp.]